MNSLRKTRLSRARDAGDLAKTDKSWPEQVFSGIVQAGHISSRGAFQPSQSDTAFMKERADP
jgi:hypothetical protein